MSQSVAAGDPLIQSRPAWKPKVLLVNDDLSVRQSLGLALQSEHFQVVTASNGQEALERYFEGYVDLVLLDLNLPSNNGWDTFERLSALNPYLAIVLVTERLNPRELAALSGASAIMEKPLNVPVLVKAMNLLAGESLEGRLQRIAAHRPILLPPEV
jgi:DNA-binding response OmpR family regulator